MFESSAALWWEEITGPAQLVRAMAQELKDGGSVFLSAPDDLPWRTEMRRSVERLLRERDPNLLVDYIDCQTDCQTDDKGNIDVAAFLLDRYAHSDVKNGYRRSSGMSIQQYVLKHEVLRNRVVWVKGMTPLHAQNWLAYCRGHRPRSCSDGLFVIECHEDFSQRRTAAGMRLFFYKDYVKFYDALLFNTMMASTLPLSPAWKQYLSTCAARLCGCDAELSQDLLDVISRQACPDPLPALMQIAEEARRGERYGNRYDADFLDSRHPFVLIREEKTDELQKLLWKAQLEILFPLLEYERLDLIDGYADEIRRGLQEAYADPDPRKPGPHYITQYMEGGRERITDPYDAEIGTLWRMNHLRMFRDGSLYLFYVPEGADRERLDLLHSIRNTLAHVKPCQPEQTAAFLNGCPYSWKGEPDRTP